ncbi:MAG: hypothetical protein FJX47_04500 [Alphaproteobacteria bacterium]|nr:hypothetical protein [Alphaproteobacteria bacterium]
MTETTTEAQTPPPEAPTAPAAPPAPPTAFAFEHKVFKLEGSVFHLDRDGHPVLQVGLASIRAALPLKSVRKHFHIATDSNDDKLLILVERALEVVGEVRLGDPLPSELIDGKVSYPVTPLVRALARARAIVRLVDWHGGQAARNLDSMALIAEASAMETDGRLGAAEEALRAALGPEVVGNADNLLESFVAEWAPIEALAVSLADLKGVVKRAEGHCANTKIGAQLREDLQRGTALLAKRVKTIRQRLAKVAESAADPPTVHKRFGDLRDLLRRERRELSRELAASKDLMEAWRDLDATDSNRLRAAIRACFRFAGAEAGGKSMIAAA